jgi:glycerophosphoryl diester phosphodiesterase
VRDLLDTDFFALRIPRAFGHRGSAGTHPENTLISFQNAIDAGAKCIEFDVHMTRDGEIVVSHDENLKRTCGDDRLIREMFYAEVAKADAGRNFTTDGASFPFRDKGVKVPRLIEVLSAFPSVRAIVEIKQTDPSLVTPLLEVIDRAGMRRRALIASEHQPPLDDVRKLAPGIPTNFSYFETGYFFQTMASRDANYRPPGDAIQIPRRYENWELVTRESVEFAHSLGLEIHVWTVNDEAEMTHLLDLGVDGIISDFPARLLTVIAKRPKL